METNISNMIESNGGTVIIHHALQSKWFGTKWTNRGDTYEGIEWLDGNSDPKPTEDAINTEIARLQAEYDAQAYARTRQPLYPDIGDQLDDLYKEGAFSASMAAKLKKVKDDNPKG